MQTYCNIFLVLRHVLWVTVLQHKYKLGLNITLFLEPNFNELLTSGNRPGCLQQRPSGLTERRSSSQ